MNLTNDSRKSDGQIRNFYAGKHVFLTGCTGFYGSSILEKLLRTCTEIGNVYIMTRKKKGLSVQERTEKFFKKEVFNTLRAKNPNFMDKVIPIHGDLQKSDLGLSAEDRRRLVNNVNIIIHNASMVYFEAKVSVLLRINVLGTQKMLELAAECPNLNAFVYVSTAYSHHYTNPIEEKFYTPPCGLKMIEDIIRADEENAAGLSKQALNDIVGKWLNQYAFSKAVAEGVVEEFARRRSVPCMIYRPSIIVNSIREPYPGWMDTKNGPYVLFLLLSLGMLHVVPVGKDVITDFVPVDMTTNGLLSAIWNYAVNRETNEPEVYNYASSDWERLNMYSLYPTLIRGIKEYPSSKMVWHPFTLFVPNLYLFFPLHVFFHVFPAIIADMVLIIQRKKPKALNAVYKISKQINVLSYFMNTSWIIKTDKLKGVVSGLNATDEEEFPFDMKRFDWEDETIASVGSLRSSINDTMDTLPYAKKRYRKFKILHYMTLTVLSVLVVYFFFKAMTDICY